MTEPRPDLISEARRILKRIWTETLDACAAGALRDLVPDEGVRGAIRRCVSSATKTYRYVLPTQILAKLADPSLDC